MSALIKRRQAGLLAGLGISVLLAKPARATGTAGAAAATADPERALLDIDPTKFSRPTTIDNRWLPLRPRTQLVYEGSVAEDGKRLAQRVVFTVTELVKTINGMQVAIVHETDIKDGKLEEQELIFFAQDDSGNLWHLGQISEVYDEGQFAGGVAWMVGHLRGAKAGIIVQADPRPNTPSYSQGYAPPPYHWTDRGRVRRVGGNTTVPAGTFGPLLLVEEFSDTEPGAIQLKYYAQGFGLVRVGWAGDDPRREVLELVRVTELGPEAMAEVHAEAFAIEGRAYVYASTAPAQRRAA